MGWMNTVASYTNLNMQAAPQTRPRFTFGVWFYLLTFYFLLGFLPLILTAKMDDASVPSALWIVSILWPVFIALLWLYASRRCYSEQLRFNDGMLWIAGSMMAGWLYLSFVIVLPVLLFAFAYSVLAAIVGDIRRSPAFAQTKWHGFVRLCYRNRMRQR